jgi:ribonuclease P protein component
MLKKSARLRAAEVAEVLARGKSVRVGPYGGKLVASNEPLRVAIVVPKKSVRTAVARNRLRRAAYRALPSLSTPSTGRLALFVRS